MTFTELPLPGAYLIELESHQDERGFFARTFCRSEYAARGLNFEVAQRSVSYNRAAGTLRGMHFQASPQAEVKTIRCIRGMIFDVIVDLRSDSTTYKQWFGLELSAENRRSVYIPVGFAHGFETLTAGAEVDYQMSEPFAPEAARGVRWDDPAFGIHWPATPTVISPRDRAYPDFRG